MHEDTKLGDDSSNPTAARLRAEAEFSAAPERRAKLLYELGEAHEAGGEFVAALAQYEAAYEAYGAFREPLEGMLRVLDREAHALDDAARRRAWVVERLGLEADTADERVRTALLRAAHLADVEGDLDGARDALREVRDLDAAPQELGATWLFSEALAVKLDDDEDRRVALEGRIASSEHDAWRGLLLMDAARSLADQGQAEAACERLLREVDKVGRTSFAAAQCLEQLARLIPDEETQRSFVVRALDLQGQLIAASLSDPEAADAAGVPRHRRSPTFQIDAELRALQALANSGQHAEAFARLDALMSLAGPSEESNYLSAFLDRRAVELASQLGDTERMQLTLANALEREPEPALAAAFAAELGREATAAGVEDAAFQAIGFAVAQDAVCVPARAAQFELLGRDTTSPRLAIALLAFAEHLEGPARDRARLRAALVWLLWGKDSARAREALEATTLPAPLRLRLARSMAFCASDDAWFDAATYALATEADAASERHLLALELTASRWRRGDRAGTDVAIALLGETDKGKRVAAYLSLLLGAPTTDEDASNHEAQDATLRMLEAGPLGAAEDTTTPDASTWTLVRGFLGLLRGNPAATKPIFSAQAATAPSALGCLLLAELATAPPQGDASAEPPAFSKAQWLERAADLLAGEDGLAAALLLEAGLLCQQSKALAEAARLLERAEDRLPGSAALVRPWALRAEAAVSVDAKRAAIDAALDAATPTDDGEAGGGAQQDPSAALCLERFTLEVLAGDPASAAGWLDRAESATQSSGLQAAAKLFRAVWSDAVDDVAVVAALDALAQMDPGARDLVAADHVRRARGAPGVSDTTDVTAGAQAALPAVRAWFGQSKTLTAALAWVATSIYAQDLPEERRARVALARLLGGDEEESLLASAASLTLFGQYAKPIPLLAGRSKAARLVNLDLSPPGSDPRRRVLALSEVGDAVSETAERDLCGLAGWSALAGGDNALALDLFRFATQADAKNIANWEGLRLAAVNLNDHAARAEAALQLGARSAKPERGAAYLEESAMSWQVLGDEARSTQALAAAFERDPQRGSAFDKLFRKLRDQKAHARLLPILETRLTFGLSHAERVKLVWEKARALRELGDSDSAMTALSAVRELEPQHVGALALSGEILIRQTRFEEAAEALATLAGVQEAPAKNRVTAGVAAVDLYENRLQRFDRSLAVLQSLHRAGLSTLPVRERLARAAARTAEWQVAVETLELLMDERPEPPGRIEAARLALAIYRDRLRAPEQALRAVEKIMAETPGDPECVDLLLTADLEPTRRRGLLLRASEACQRTLRSSPFSLDTVRLLARVAAALSDRALERAAVGVAGALGDHGAETALRHVVTRPRVAAGVFSAQDLASLRARGDDGPAGTIFQLLGPSIAEALGPNLQAMGVTKKDRVDPRAGLGLRAEVAAWLAAFGVQEFDMYVGGRDPHALTVIAGSPFAVVVGTAITSPLSAQQRGRLAAETYGAVRGISALRHRDDATIVSIAIAACQKSKVQVQAESPTVLAEVSRVLLKALPGKVAKLLVQPCQELASSRQDLRVWSAAASLSMWRVALVASADPTGTLAELLGSSRNDVAQRAPHDLRCGDLLTFVLSPAYAQAQAVLRVEDAS